MPEARAYVDTSVLGAYYCPEALSAAAEKALVALREPVISTLTEVELTSLVMRKRRMRELSAHQANEVLQLFHVHMEDGFFRRIALGTEHFIRARDLIARMTGSLRTLDALHLAAAIDEKLPLLTADRDLYRAARHRKADAILLV